MLKRRGALKLTIALLSITFRPGLAQEPPASQPGTVAQKAYAEAKTLRSQGKYREEIDALSRACSAGAFEACHDLGVAFDRGAIVPQDRSRATQLYSTACDHNVNVSCSNLGLMYEQGQGVKQDLTQAVRLYIKACNLHMPKACNNAAYMYLNGIGVSANAAKSADLFWHACRSKYSMSCNNLADLYLRGTGVRADLGRSLRLRIRACRQLFQAACKNLEDTLLKLAHGATPLSAPRQRIDETEQLDQRELEARLALAHGKFEEARRLLGQALNMLPDHDVAGAEEVLYFVLLNSRTYEEEGRLNYARAALEDHLKVIDHLNAPAQNAYMALLLVKLSRFDEQADDMALARDHLKRALALEQTLGVSDSADLATGYADLGRLCDTLEDRTCALDAFKKAWFMADGAGDKQLAAASLNNIGTQLTFTGDYRQAADNFAQALSIRTKILAPDDPIIAQNLGNLSFAYGGLGDWVQAVSFQRQELELYAKTVGRRVIRGESILDSPYDKHIEREWGGILSWSIALDMLSAGRYGSREIAAAAIATLRGFRTETLRAAIDALRTSPSAKNSSLLEMLRQAQQALSSAYYVKPSDVGSWPTLLSNVRIQLSDAEARTVEAVWEGKHQETLTNDAVGAAVPPHAALIVYAVYFQVNIRAHSAAERWSGTRLAAYVFRRDHPTASADLGSIDRILDKRDSVLGKLRHPNAVSAGELRELYQLILDPLEPFLSGADELIVVPGEELAAVPFEALIGPDGKYLVESTSIRYLADASELVELNSSQHPERAALPNAVVVAAPDYLSGPGLALGTGRRLHFASLSGAAAEGALVAQKLGSRNLLSGRQATKAFIRALHGPPVLHIASHGFFLRSGITPAAAAEMVRIVSESLVSQPGNYHLMEFSEPATIRAGIALSGANGSATDTGNPLIYEGILFGLEIAGLDLRHTELAVLSACETGLGEPTLGEGLDGLRTALRIAGARTRVLSLWPISDCATMQFMDNWYGRMVSGEDRVDALRRAKLDMLLGRTVPTRACSARGISLTETEKQKPEWSDPYFWAPFIAEGAQGQL